jgi:preprotein translocase subunit YajC
MNLFQAQPGGFDPMLMLLIMAVFFFFMIWPQMRRQKKAKTFISSIAKGQHIVTTGGVHGKISQVNEKFFIIDIEEGKMKIDPSAINMESTQAAYPAETKTEEKK